MAQKMTAEAQQRLQRTDKTIPEVIVAAINLLFPVISVGCGMGETHLNFPSYQLLQRFFLAVGKLKTRKGLAGLNGRKRI